MISANFMQLCIKNAQLMSNMSDPLNTAKSDTFMKS